MSTKTAMSTKTSRAGIKICLIKMSVCHGILEL
jgi:hypothetical protein